jgi:hypothetical protein
MSDSQPEFNVGDPIWFANCGTREIQISCPVCFGKKAVRVELGDGSLVTTDCQMCGLGFEPPRGFVTQWEWIAEPKREVIERKSVEENRGERAIQYQSRTCYSREAFSSKEEAMARCLELAAEHAAEEKERLEWSKEKAHKSYSWHVGYHRREAKELRRRAEFHDARAVACQARIKQEATL